MRASKKKTVTYFYRGLIERWQSRGCVLVSGYSQNSPEGNPYYPWNTRVECRVEARREGARAVFQTSNERSAGQP